MANKTIYTKPLILGWIKKKDIKILYINPPIK